MRISFRFDDPSASSDHSLEARILALFRKHDVPLTVAVVPYDPADVTRPLTASDVPHLVDAHQQGLIEVALHGLAHQRYATTRSGVPTEFAGRPLAEQLAMMKRGRDVLERAFSSPINGFVPPWNTFDRLTLIAARETGFRFLGGGIRARSGPKSISVPIVIPKTSRFDRSHMADLFHVGAQYARFNPWAVLVFHPDNFAEFRSQPAPAERQPWLTLGWLDEILDRLTSEGSAFTPMTLFDALSANGRGSRLWDSNELGWVSRFSFRAYRALPRLLLFPGSRWSALGAIAGSAVTR